MSGMGNTPQDRLRLTPIPQVGDYFVGDDNKRLEQQVAQLGLLLSESLIVDTFFNLEGLKQVPNIPVFHAGHLGVIETSPAWQAYLPSEPSALERLLPGAKQRQEQKLAEAHQRYQADLAAHAQREAARMAALTEHRANYERYIAQIREQTAAQHTEIQRLEWDFAAGEPYAVSFYFTRVLEASKYPENFPKRAKVAYLRESKQLIVEYDLPPFDIVPEVGSYKYIKTRNEIVQSPRPMVQRKALYSSVVAQITLRTLHELFKADRTGHLETVVFNGYVDSIDRGTGREVRPCLVTVRATRDTFTQIDLSRVEPAACLKVLNAAVSKSPEELVAVRPVVEFNMTDPRFIQETDVLSGLDQRPNLMELTPSEFENLISNLFEKMGLETRLTQPSRDGGVDCVAYDSRPILGGKVVIQAKRYKHTVGVSAVRDLYGTVLNEGASKGILVTTSGYGQAAFDFAKGKPLELYSGSHLLSFLAEYAGVQAKIEVPADWKDPQLDS